MDNPLNCSICWRRFTAPAVLNCGHTFDRDCVTGQTVCPLCREPIISLDTNWQLVSVLESTREQLDDDSEESSRWSWEPVTDWSAVPPGSLVSWKIQIKRRTGWFTGWSGTENTVSICQSHGGVVNLPVELVGSPKVVKMDRSTNRNLCCVLL